MPTPASTAVSLPLMALFALCVGCAHPMGSRLESAHEARRVPEPLALTYEELSPAWGGRWIRLHGDGRIEVRRIRPDFAPAQGRPEDALEEGEGLQGARGERILSARLEPSQLAPLLALLVELEAWEHRGGVETAPLVDRGRARLELRLGDSRSTIWEWIEDLEAQDRLLRVRAELQRLIERTESGRESDADPSAADRAEDPEP
ncbi:MAG: hypothetical protein OEY14_05210 [Myxococcales bacterium]|nr:hypothetical protein [Myxococcales bacterium]